MVDDPCRFNKPIISSFCSSALLTDSLSTALEKTYGIIAMAAAIAAPAASWGAPFELVNVAIRIIPAITQEIIVITQQNAFMDKGGLKGLEKIKSLY